MNSWHELESSVGACPREVTFASRCLWSQGGVAQEKCYETVAMNSSEPVREAVAAAVAVCRAQPLISNAATHTKKFTIFEINLFHCGHIIFPFIFVVK